MLAGSLLLMACDTGQLPPGASLSVTPAARRFEITALADSRGACHYDPASYQDIPVLVALRDAQGSPLTRAGLLVHADYADNVFTGLDVLNLYDDSNGNGVIDGASELVTGKDAPPFTTYTGRYTGERHFWLRVNLSCPYTGEVRVIAGPLTGQLRIEVVATHILTDPVGRELR